MRLRLDELDAWRGRAAQTVRPDDHPVPYPSRLMASDEAQYELALRRYAWGALADLANHGAPQPDDAERRIAHARSHMVPARTDTCRSRVGPGGRATCDGSCERAAPPA